MKPRDLSGVILVLLLAACGGGGGGGSGGTAQPGGGTEPPGSGTEPPGGGASTGASNAKIVFPWRKSSAVGKTVIVRGTASDPDGVASVSVNGALAAVTSSPSGGFAKSEPDTRARASSHTSLASDDDASAEVEWSVEVELEPGDNDIVVAVEDETGDVTTEADAAEVKYAEVPELFSLDGEDPRLLGWSTTLTASGPTTRLVEFDHASRQQTVYPELHDVGVAGCFRSHSGELLYLRLAAEDLWEVHSFNLTTRAAVLVAEIPPELLSPGPGFSTGPLLMQLACGGVHEHAYLLASYWENGNPALSRVLKIALSGGVSMLTETDPNESPRWLARRIALAQDALVGLYDIDAHRPLTRIALGDGAREPLAQINVGGLAITAPLEHGRVYVTTFDGVEEVLLTDPPTKRNVSAAGPTDPLHFSQADSIGVDLVNNRVIVGDSDLDVLIAIDLATGERSELLSRSIGAGPPLIAPRRLAITEDGTTAYVADDGSNAPERLFEVDLTTGDRRVIGQIHEQGVNRSITGLALDEENGHAYVSRLDGGTVLRIDLETEAVAPITSDADGMLEHISDIVLDPEGQRLLVADTATEAIVAVDLVSHQKQLISRAGERGAGEAFATLTSLTRAGDGASLYAADQATNQVVHVDLETGDRAAVELSCVLGEPETLQQVLYDAARDELLILADDIFAFDPETSACARIDPRTSALRLQLTPDGRILAAGFNAVMHIDRGSGDIVLVSQ